MEVTRAIERRVKRGIKLLNKFVPNWAYKVKIRKFDVTDPNNCLLTHIFGDLDIGIEKLSIVDIDNKINSWGYFGFDIISTGDIDADGYQFEQLQNCWLKWIRAYRNN